MRAFSYWFCALLIGLVLVCAGPAMGEQPVAADPLAPGAPTVLIIDLHSPERSGSSSHTGLQVEMLLRHFTPHTERINAAEYSAGRLFAYDRVVVIGNGPDVAPPRTMLEDLEQADRPALWIGYGLENMSAESSEISGFVVEPPADQSVIRRVEYRGQRYPAVTNEYQEIRITKPSTEVLAAYSRSAVPGVEAQVPYIVHGGELWYVNGLPMIDTAYPSPKVGIPSLIFADVLHDFFETAAGVSRHALVRLEDVSINVDPARLREVVDYLRSEHIPFAVGIIPAQRLEDGTVVELSERPELVATLRYAQDSGGTIILHGYHHTFGSGEDYEFWDEKRNAPIAGERWDTYAAKVEDGIRIMRDLGLEPRMWETPHYAASPLAYRVFSRYFSHAVENRDPVSWLPYPAGPDEYGQMLIPENLGYINPQEGRTVRDQLERADALRIVRDSWAVGFYHPVSIPPSELQKLVRGLQEQGYTFVDLRSLPAEVRYDYRPGPLTRLSTWFRVDTRLKMLLVDQRLEQRFAWWSTAERVPWLTVVAFSLILLFIVRLPTQWRPAERGASTLVEGSLRTSASRAPPRVFWVITALAVGTALCVGLFGVSNGAYEASDDDSLQGWSALEWSVKYDGYGRVAVEDGILSLRPQAALRPGETRAALVLADSPKWRDYSFTVRMSLREQLRRNSRSNPWETGWLFFRYQAEDRSYYLAHKTNGLELGKLVPPEGTGQVFLVTKPHPAIKPGEWHDYRIELDGPTIRVYVDDELQITYTDPNPILAGGVGLYTEDARVEFVDPAVEERPASDVEPDV